MSRKPEPGLPRPVYRSSGCFVCGTDSEAGLGLALTWDGRRTAAHYVPRLMHRGYGKLLHGGIVCAMLDEAICIAVGERIGSKVVTVSLEVDYRRPVRVGKPVRLQGWHTRSVGRFHYGRGEIVDVETGRLLTLGRLKAIRLARRKTAAFQG